MLWQREKKTSEKSGKGQTERKSPGTKEFRLWVFRLLLTIKLDKPLTVYCSPLTTFFEQMDQDKLRTLKLLEAIDSSEPPTQRELARDLNISLGLVNAFIKRLAKKGYFKITTIPKKRAKYLLTPKGALEKSRLTYEYIRYSVGFYREIREMLVNLFGRLEREGVEKIALYGCGEVAELAHLFLQNTSIKLAGVFDERSDGRNFFGQRVKSHEQLAKDGYEYVLLTQTEDIQTHFDRIVDLGVKPECILHLRGYSELDGTDKRL